MPSYIDIAVNLLGSALEQDTVSIIQAAADQGVSPLIVIGSDLTESAAAIAVCEQYLTNFTALLVCIPTMPVVGMMAQTLDKLNSVTHRKWLPLANVV